MHCKQDPLMELSLTRRVVIFIIGVVESMLFAGTVFGWPQLVHVFKVEGLYSHLCDDSTTLHHNHTARPPPAHNPFNNTRCWDRNTTFQFSSSHKVGVEQCEAQDERFALIFTVTVGCYSVPAVLVGFLLHHAGLRVTRVSAGTMMSMGFLFLGMATKESPNWVFVAMILMALGGNQLRMSVMQFGDLFPLHRSTAITLLSGMYAASASLFLVFQYTADAGIARAHVCWVLAGISALSIFLSFIMPVHHIPVLDIYETREATKDPPPLGKSLWSGSSYLHQFWFFIMLFAINVYQQTYNVWVTGSSCSVREAGLYSMFFSYSNLFTVFFGPLGGAFTDYMVRRARDTPSEVGRRVKEIQAPFWPLLISSLATTITYACILVFRPLAVYISLVAMVVARPCVIAVSTAYLRIRFPAEHFNRLLGIYGSVSSLLMFLQYPHFMWAQHMYYPAHALVLALLVLSYTNPIHLLFTPLMRDAVVIRDQLEEEQLCPVRTLKKTFRESP
ncbi:equilibrative nucleobase transporter 1 isoform X2 [Procambarus clarkii]|uniref:equilibrative nucleobase transporter 1 isoform X2 n=2 Tax=Procambarus clarkii TaxID=6728 RepID=UPI001E672DF1|nr:solute carrier family 43 member 3-like isoform X2 [Procambarus clarkii]